VEVASTAPQTTTGGGGGAGGVCSWPRRSRVFGNYDVTLGLSDSVCLGLDRHVAEARQFLVRE